MFAEGQMHSYKVINKMFFQPYERLKVGAEIYKYHFISTVLLKSYTEGYGTANENRVVAAAGRADLTDPLFDWIIELTQQQRTVKGELKNESQLGLNKIRMLRILQMSLHFVFPLGVHMHSGHRRLADVFTAYIAIHFVVQLGISRFGC